MRLRGYDYSGVGAYFITVCVDERRLAFGRACEETIALNLYGKIVAHEWEQTALMRERVELDEWVVMPNHFHGLLWFTEPPLQTHNGPKSGLWRAPDSLGSLVGGWKGAVSSAIKKQREAKGWPQITVWQRGYHDHIVRDERELEFIRRYIRENPARWNQDVEFRSKDFVDERV